MTSLEGAVPLILGGVESEDPLPCGVLDSRYPKIAEAPRASWHVQSPSGALISRSLGEKLPGVSLEGFPRAPGPNRSGSLLARGAGSAW